MISIQQTDSYNNANKFRNSASSSITDGYVIISKEGQVEMQKLKYRNFSCHCLVNCIWYICSCFISWHMLYIIIRRWIMYYYYYNFTAGCGEPTPPSRGSIGNFQSAAEGATITYSCSPGLVPRTRMSAVCMNMTWSPDPAILKCREPGEYCCMSLTCNIWSTGTPFCSLSS